MEPNQYMAQPTPQPVKSGSKSSVKDLFLNLGTTVALATVITNFINLLFTVINRAFPQINSYYGYYSDSISFPVSALIIFFPVYILLMWILEKEYALDPEKRHLGIRKWLSSITLFLSGLALVGDLVTILYYFIDGREIGAGFIMKFLVVLAVSLIVFLYYISDIRGKLNSSLRKIWTVTALVVILFSIVWGFSVLGSPRSQQLFKYDQQKVSGLQSLSSNIKSYYYQKNSLPQTLDMMTDLYYSTGTMDSQIGKPYEYIKTGDMDYQLCAVFNKESVGGVNGKVMFVDSYNQSWSHPAGRYCFTMSVNPNYVR